MKSYLSSLRTPIQDQVVFQLLEKNHREHHIFFEGGKHNHFPHVLLSDYALGADEARLCTEWKFEDYLEPAPKETKQEITEENWRDFIRDQTAYPAYFTFFMGQIKSHGVVETLKRFLFEENLLLNFLGGAVHPLIHTSFGVEFGVDTLIGEGLSMAACSNPILGDLDIGFPSKDSPRVSLLEIFNRIRQDTTITPLLRWDEPNKREAVIQRLSDHVKRYTQLYYIPEDGEGIVEALKDLYLHSALFFGGSAFHPLSDRSEIDYNNIKPDFFVMHVLTSALSLRTILPELDLVSARRMLQGHVATQIIYYIRSGRPPINIEALETYPIPTKLDNWCKLVNLAICSKDIHLAKVLRACLLGSRLMTDIPTKEIAGTLRVHYFQWPPASIADSSNSWLTSSGLFRKPETLSKIKTDTNWFRVAVLAVAHKELHNRKWEMRGPGWTDAWNVSIPGQ